MNELTVVADLSDYLDATPKTVDTYTRALKQLFDYFAINCIRQPRK